MKPFVRFLFVSLDGVNSGKVVGNVKPFVSLNEILLIQSQALLEELVRFLVFTLLPEKVTQDCRGKNAPGVVPNGQ